MTHDRGEVAGHGHVHVHVHANEHGFALGPGPRSLVRNPSRRAFAGWVRCEVAGWTVGSSQCWSWGCVGHGLCQLVCHCLWIWGCGLAVLGCTPSAALGWSWTGQVVHVSDGDTLWVQPDHGGEARQLRLTAIDAPELCQAWGRQAWLALRTRLQGQQVQVVVGRLDSYGRWLAQVWHQGQDVGAWMVVQGHAWSPSYRGMPGPYDPLQREAQGLRRGLFAHPWGLMSPREFRRWHGRC
ncbi:MAG: hypothetical protein RJA69_1301 [Pseudomonadota bacterium]|jgi:micrococcal nuclease